MISLDTKQAVYAAVAQCDSVRKAAQVVQVHHAVLADILADRHDHVSRQSENRVRIAVGLPPLPAPISVEPCPDCGSVHVGRCHGKDGETVVLAATERVVAAKPAPKRKRQLVRPVANENQETRRQALCATWRQIIDAGLDALERKAKQP